MVFDGGKSNIAIRPKIIANIDPQSVIFNLEDFNICMNLEIMTIPNYHIRLYLAKNKKYPIKYKLYFQLFKQFIIFLYYIYYLFLYCKVNFSG